MIFRREADPTTGAFKDVNHGRSGFANGSRDGHRLGTVRAKQGLGKFYHNRPAGASSVGGVMSEYGPCFTHDSSPILDGHRFDVAAYRAPIGALVLAGLKGGQGRKPHFPAALLAYRDVWIG